MPFIPLRTQRKAYLGGVEQTGMFLGGSKVWAKPASIWTRVIPQDGGPSGAGTAFRGIVSQNPDGSYRVTTMAGNSNGRCYVDMPEHPANTRILLEYSIAFNSATRLICRQVENNFQTGGITVFDITRAVAGTDVLVGANNFLTVLNRRYLHFIGVTAAGGFFTINPQTRWRLNPNV